MKFLILILPILFFSCVVSGDKQAIFNGSNFSGWKRNLGGDAGYFYIKDSSIIGKLVSRYTVKSSSFLSSEKRYKNFELTLEFLPTNFSTFIIFRSRPLPFNMSGKKVVDYLGYKYHIDLNGRQTGFVSVKYKEDGKIKEELLTKPNKEATELAEFKKDDWNKLKIRCYGGKIQTWLNGSLVSDFRNSKIPSGIIALELPVALNDTQVGKKISFRNIHIQKIK